MTQNAFAAALAAFQQAGGDMSQFQNATSIGQDRLVRKEVSLGAIRELEPPQNHIGLTIAPFLSVPTDDVIFNYLTVQTDGLAPARAEDAEAELAQKDQTAAGEGRASVIDWSLKDHYDASDVNRARDFQRIIEAMNNGSLPLTATSALEDWQAKLARDRALRRRKLDNRMEHLIITQALSTGSIAYDDGKIKFAVDYGRPANQSAGNAAFDLASAGITDGVWDISSSTGDFDPIRFFNELSQRFFDTYGVRRGQAIASKKVLNTFWRSDKFSQRAGLGAAYDGSGNPVAPDLLYATTGWSPAAARAVVAASTDVELVEYDSVYRTRPIGSNTVTANRFLPVNRMILLPKLEDLGEISDTQIGFAKTLTSPHPEGNWQSGFYEWEKSTVDPWGQDVGNGIKAFPVFPHMEFTATVNVTLPA